jgi:hypothetical protein
MDFMFEDEVDEVGSDVEAYCPKCKADTTHVVISKYEEEIRRVQCNPCGDVHSFRKPRGEAEDDVPEPVAARKRAMLKKPGWEEFFARRSPNDAKPYEFREAYRENIIVHHPKFGVGFVSEVVSDSKVEITFQDARRILVHNRRDIPGLPLAAEGDGMPTPAKGAKDAARAAAQEAAREAAREATREAREAAREAVREAARNGAREGKAAAEAKESVKESGREAAKDDKSAKEAAKEAGRDGKGAARPPVGKAPAPLKAVPGGKSAGKEAGKEAPGKEAVKETAKASSKEAAKPAAAHHRPEPKGKPARPSAAKAAKSSPKTTAAPRGGKSAAKSAAKKPAPKAKKKAGKKH